MASGIFPFWKLNVVTPQIIHFYNIKSDYSRVFVPVLYFVKNKQTIEQQQQQQQQQTFK